MPGWIDRLGRTASNLDHASKRVADGYQRSRQLARTVSSDVEQALVVAQPKLQEAAQGVARWGRGVFRAAARALGDVQQHASAAANAARSEPEGPLQHTEDARDIRSSLRNRGGVRLARKAPDSSPTAANSSGKTFLGGGRS